MSAVKMQIINTLKCFTMNIKIKWQGHAVLVLCVTSQVRPTLCQTLTPRSLKRSQRLSVWSQSLRMDSKAFHTSLANKQFFTTRISLDVFCLNDVANLCASVLWKQDPGGELFICQQRNVTVLEVTFFFTDCVDEIAWIGETLCKMIVIHLTVASF